MKYNNKKDYESPKMSLILFSPTNTFASMSAHGDIMDFEEGGKYDGEYADPLS